MASDAKDAAKPMGRREPVKLAGATRAIRIWRALSQFR